MRFEAAEKSPEAAAVTAGFKMVAQQLEQVLTRYHCTSIAALHEPFDPHRHQAIAQQPSDEFPAGHGAAGGTEWISASRPGAAAGAGDRIDRPGRLGRNVREFNFEETTGYAHLRLRVRRLQAHIRVVPGDEGSGAEESARSAAN